MSRETNSVSLKKAFMRPFSEPRLIGFAALEIGVMLLAGLFFYALAVRILMTQYAIPLETFMSFMAADALPPEASSLVTVLTVVFGILFSLIVVFFEAGLFGVIAKKKSFFAAAKKSFIAFVLIMIVFEAIDLLLLLLYLPTLLFPLWMYAAYLFFLLFKLFLFVWRMLAQFEAVNTSAFQSLKASFSMLKNNVGYWGRAVFTIVLAVFFLIFLTLALLMPASLHPISLFLILIILGVTYVYFALVMRIFFFNRIRSMKR